MPSGGNVAGENQGGDKTEKPTPKRIADARRKGDVAKSRDATSLAVLLVWLITLVFAVGFAGTRLAGLFEASFTLIARGGSFADVAASLGWSAVLVLLAITAMTLIPAAAAGLLAEFLQTGGVFALDKVKPSLDKLNPFEGLKRMFSLDNIVELLKTLAKAALVIGITWIVLRASLGDILDRTGPALQPVASSDGQAAAASVLSYTGGIVRTVLLWTVAVFLVVAVLDVAYQRHAYLKKLRMSLRDIRQESRENEGDPLIRQSRRQLHEEWANQNAVGAARTANVLVVNPTHIAIALDYDPETTPVPIMAAKGEGPLAQAMREAAEEAGVPIVRYISVARQLYEHGAVNELIPRDMFEAIAQIITWAQRARETGERSTEMKDR
jgi:type III secretion protein U